MKRFFLIMLLQWTISAQNQELNVAGLECSDCHGGDDWTTLSLKGFSHSITNFPLQGSHRIQDCASCHQGNTVAEKHQFSLDENECSSCHLDVHKNKLGNDCAQCHGNDSWQVTTKTFNHELTQFSLLGSHKQTLCRECHTETPMTNFDLTPTDCYDCHRLDYDRSTNPAHIESRLNTDCEECHSTSQSSWTPSTFVHELVSDFILDGAHKSTPCAKCHSGGTYDFPENCWSCHETEFIETGTSVFPDAPSHIEAGYSQDCLACHSTSTWKGAVFDHNETEFPLLDAHNTITCNQCHGDGNYDLPMDCAGCHVDGGLASTNSLQSDYDHESHQINETCENCHVGSHWADLIFNHINFTNTDCKSCHIPEQINSINPPHADGNISPDCEVCHATTESWTISPFTHTVSQTDYLLTGAHLTTNCESCHVNEIYNNTPNDCWSCHEQDFNETGTSVYPDSPSHSDDQYSQNCEVCHSTETWEGAEFDHSLTDFPLGGAHALIDCEQCHDVGNFDLPSDCSGCHIDGGLATTNSTTSDYNHTSHNINNNCALCHADQSWEELIFDHVNFTETNCQECHTPEHENSTDPIHGNNNISTDCALCHPNSSEWIIDPFPHTEDQTSFILFGLHLTTDCNDCHINNIINNTPNSCQDGQCHLSDFNETTDPDHSVYGYSVDICEECHNPLGWSPDIYAHTLSAPCATCHFVDYQNASNPPHTTGQGFSETCENCHTGTDTWEGATFEHTNITTGCADCHMADFEEEHDDGFPTECEQCHTSTSDWEDVDFNHSSITEGCASCHMEDFYEEHNDGDPTNCEACHTTEDWDDVTFDHDGDYFPIYSGEHEDEWTSCEAECHVNPDDYTDFSCGLNGVCHDHDQSEMDDEHDEESDYVYESSACYNCHPNGSEDDGDDGDLLRFWIKKQKKYNKPIFK